MQGPNLLPTSANKESFGGVSYHLDGELVPALTIELNGNIGVYFEHHTLLWKHTSIEIGVKSLQGTFKRMFAGLPIIMTEARGRGQVAFSRDGTGHIFPIHLTKGREIHVREHQFLAATDNVDYSFQRLTGVGNILFGGNQFFIDKFSAQNKEGIIWLHGFGNVFEVELGAGEQIDVEPGAWLYKDPSVQMETNLMSLSTGLLAGSSVTMNRFSGPGKLAIQSMPSLLPTAGTETGAASAGLGALLLGLLKK